MNESSIAIIGSEKVTYPDDNSYYRPHREYPEYLFPKMVSQNDNYVYDMVRESFRKLELDIKNYNTARWNPLGEFIKPGDNVLIKPNLVLDKNYNPTGSTESVYTHPSVTAAVIDYVLIAMKGEGEIIIGDAPVQECRFDKLIQESGYEELINWYRKNKVNIKLVDLRSSSNQSNSEGGVQYPQNICNRENGVLVRLGLYSAFCDVPEDIQKRMRVTNFDPRILQKHHTGNKHDYMVAKELLQADVIINLPKPKTHKIAGITAAQKNMFGSFASKDYLPHHTIGSKDENGDAYLHKNYWLSVAEDVMDIKNIFNRENMYDKARKAAEFFGILYGEGHVSRNKEEYENGCWYGNDTIWRTIADVNRIVLYADKKGVIKESPQRKMFIVGDMIIAGEKNGPVAPSDRKVGLIIAGADALAFDRVVCAVMGFDEKLIPQLQAENMCPTHLPFKKGKKPVVLCNMPRWEKSELAEIRTDSLHFLPASSWEYALGNHIKDRMLIETAFAGKSLVIFGAGANGIGAYQYIKKRHPDVKVNSFWDNDGKKQGKVVVDEIKCKAPGKASDDEVCLICAGQHFIASLYIEAVVRGFADENIIIFSSNFIGNGVDYKGTIIRDKQ